MDDDENDAVEVADEESETETEAVTETEPAETATEGETAETAEATSNAAETEEAEPEPTFDEGVTPGEDTDLPIPVEDYLAAGIHIDTQRKAKDMVRFIHRVRGDRLYVLDVSQTDSRIHTVANFLANYNPEQILVTSSRQYGRFPVEKFADAVGARARMGRFIPGTLTNPDYAGYIEPGVVVVTDPIDDARAIKEAITVSIPVAAIYSSNNQASNVDFVVPTNNEGRRALSVVYWLLASETLDRRDFDTVYTLEDFEAEL